MTSPKTAACRIHAKRRALQRHGVDINRATLRDIVAQIQSGRARFLGRDSLRTSRWRVAAAGRPMTVVYDRERKTVVTVLPPPPDAKP